MTTTLIPNNTIVIYSSDMCPYCHKAKKLLTTKGVTFEERNVDVNPDLRREMTELTNGLTSVPQIWVDGNHIGGCDELTALDSDSKLDTLLANHL